MIWETRTPQDNTAGNQAAARRSARLRAARTEHLLASWLIELLEKLKELLLPEQPVLVPVRVPVRQRPRPGVRGVRPSR